VLRFRSLGQFEVEDENGPLTAPADYLLRIPAEAVDLTEFERLVARGRAALSTNDLMLVSTPRGARSRRRSCEAANLWRDCRRLLQPRQCMTTWGLLQVQLTVVVTDHAAVGVA
jgi:hypothetical protein